MNQEMIEALLNWLMWISLDALLLIAAACAYVGLRRLGKALCVRLSPVAIGVFAVAAIVATGEAQKQMLRGGALGDRALPEYGPLGDRALPSVTAEEIAQGWRLESVVTNDAVSYVMPTNGVEYMPWSLGGGYEAHFPLDLGDFAFPFGTNVVRRVDVVSGGMVESLPRPSCMSICAAREYASIVPGVGRFWWADTVATERDPPNQVKLITWENVYAGRDRTGLYNAQIELCGDGNFITRSNNVERVYRRVNPDDWDGDGLANEIDPNPMAYDGDLFGTGVAWLNANCGSVLSASADTNGEISVSWHTNVCGAAYYWLQFTAQRDSTRIVIDCEGESTLGDMFVVANSNQVCKVPLLMGPDYHVTASHPVADVSASDAEAEVRPASRDVSGGDFNVKRGVEHGVPVRRAKLGNFLAGYGTKRLGVWSASRWLS